jgi:hypothetical protein
LRARRNHGACKIKICSYIGSRTNIERQSNYMIDMSDVDRATSVIGHAVKTLHQLQSLLKTDGGRLTEAGKAVMRAALESGMTKVQIAELLSVSAAAISYHTV